MYDSHVYAKPNLPLLQSSTSWYIHILQFVYKHTGLKNNSLTMDSKISEFLNEGNMHPTRKSHRNAAKSYFEFLLLLYLFHVILHGTPHFYLFYQIYRYFKCHFFQNMPSTVTSEYTKVSFNIFVKFTQKYHSTASLNFNFYNFVKKWNFWNSISAFFWCSWPPIFWDFAQKKSGYKTW